MSKALVLLSGGADSTICAAIASQNHDEVHAITIAYGQRHSIEIDASKAVAGTLGLASHEIVDIGFLKGSSPLVSNNPVETYGSAADLPDGIASTFVPNRNAVFLMVAANRAIALGCDTVYTGVCATDFSGYPDCKREFIDAIEVAVRLGNEVDFKIETPLMYLSKAQSVLLALEVMGDRFNAIMGLSQTCYNAVKGGCGHCAACLLRDRGFREAGIDDPIWGYRRVAN